MMKVAQELQNIKYAYKKTIRIQRQGFQLELEKINKKLEMVESRAIVFEKKVQLLKNYKLLLKKELAQSAYTNTNQQNKVVIDQ